MTKQERYENLLIAVQRALKEADPIGLIEIGAPNDEYALEIETILPKLWTALEAYRGRA